MRFANLEDKDKDVQLEALNSILAATKEEVDWVYEVWDQLMEWLSWTRTKRNLGIICLATGRTFEINAS